MTVFLLVPKLKTTKLKKKNIKNAKEIALILFNQLLNIFKRKPFKAHHLLKFFQRRMI